MMVLQEHLVDIEQTAHVIVDGYLQYSRTESIDVSNGNGSIFEYHIYNIVPINIEKGCLENNELKILISQNIEIKEGCLYKLYINQYNGYPSSLVNPYNSIIEIE